MDGMYMAAGCDTLVEQRLEPVFTGSGAEYFRIWIVNLSLTVLTLGIYSAWAKVRRLQYFDRNTVLDGACFDFHGKPWAVLRGRLVAVGLALAYHYGFGFSSTTGLVVLVAVLLALPLLLRGALRFRLRNTSHRGLHLGFSGSARQAYLAYLPMILLFTLPTLLQGLGAPAALVGLAGVLWFSWPACHGLFKCYQHQHIQYGSLDSRTGAVATEFFGPYMRASLLGSLCALGLAAVVGIAAAAIGGEEAGWISLTAGVLAAYVAFLASGPFLQAAITNLMWNQTDFDGVRFESSMEAWPFIRLQAKNVLLTLLTLGLYRPFAAVATYRYRLAHMAVLTMVPAASVTAGTALAAGAAGDGAADLLDFDISW
jgi:uncharacterized membrane protein YjgN (DUF898 family)